MPRRVYVTLPDTVYASLERWAKLRGQAIATTAAIAVELSVRQAEDKGEIPPFTETAGEEENSNESAGSN
ncbi:MAG: hypothetical protein AAF572_28755 [Cyanobacteria bacterium P01_B01_bin.77]